MNGLDAFLAAGQALAAVHGAVDQTINATLYYGPGVLATAAAVAAWRTGQWAVRRYDQWLQDRADRAYYAARNLRDSRIAYIADAVTAMPTRHLIADLNAKYAAADLANEGEER
ncbi:hypothetical protein [Streptomyces anulatus]|uniref:hypothetical protein n=1 Tax=Streptomyces anulatus TaxID=1892 RepID=UPI002ED524DB|nr:hypothetical protein OG703_33505 [Streptomyces anulatus]